MRFIIHVSHTPQTLSWQNIWSKRLYLIESNRTTHSGSSVEFSGIEHFLCCFNTRTLPQKPVGCRKIHQQTVSLKSQETKQACCWPQFILIRSSTKPHRKRNSAADSLCHVNLSGFNLMGPVSMNTCALAAVTMPTVRLQVSARVHATRTSHVAAARRLRGVRKHSWEISAVCISLAVCRCYCRQTETRRRRLSLRHGLHLFGVS